MIILLCTRQEIQMGANKLGITTTSITIQFLKNKAEKKKRSLTECRKASGGN